MYIFECLFLVFLKVIVIPVSPKTAPFSVSLS